MVLLEFSFIIFCGIVFLVGFERMILLQVFAPVTSIQPSYKTLLLMNSGTNPVNFSFDEDDSRYISPINYRILYSNSIGPHSLQR